MMSISEDEIQNLIELVRPYGIALEEVEARKLLHHLFLLQEKNKQINLTRIVAVDEALSLHILDSLLFLFCLKSKELSESDLYIDLGTGGGYPGIPLSIMLPCKALLVDSVAKKARAVDEFINSLGLSGRVSTSSLRAEELAKELPSSGCLITARAVAGLSTLIEYASPLLKQGGWFIASKGRIEDDELFHASRAARLCGMRSVSRETFDLPFEQGHREIFVYEKIEEPKMILPRKVGMAKHNPL